MMKEEGRREKVATPSDYATILNVSLASAPKPPVPLSKRIKLTLPKEIDGLKILEFDVEGKLKEDEGRWLPGRDATLSRKNEKYTGCTITQHNPWEEWFYIHF